MINSCDARFSFQLIYRHAACTVHQPPHLHAIRLPPPQPLKNHEHRRQSLADTGTDVAPQAAATAAAGHRAIDAIATRHRLVRFRSVSRRRLTDGLVARDAIQLGRSSRAGVVGLPVCTANTMRPLILINDGRTYTRDRTTDQQPCKAVTGRGRSSVV